MRSCIFGKAEAERGMEDSRGDNRDGIYEDECDRSCPQQDGKFIGEQSIWGFQFV